MRPALRTAKTFLDPSNTGTSVNAALPRSMRKKDSRRTWKHARSQSLSVAVVYKPSRSWASPLASASLNR